MAQDEALPLVNEDGHVVGSARRSEVHGDPTLMHPVVHCLVTNDSGELLLQLRGRFKDVQPGRWDTSVGGHVGLDESIEEAVLREIHEELGLLVRRSQLSYLYRYVMRSAIETELVYSFRLVHAGPFVAESCEIDALRFWLPDEITAHLGTGTLTPNFEDEFSRYRVWLGSGTEGASRG